MSAPPTPLMKRCVAAIEDLTVDGVAPSYEELAAALGMKGKGHLSALLTSMRERGLVDWLPRRARTIHVLAQPSDLEQLPTWRLEKLRDEVAGILARRQA